MEQEDVVLPGSAILAEVPPALKSCSSGSWEEARRLVGLLGRGVPTN